MIDWYYIVDESEPEFLAVGIYDTESDWEVGGPFPIDEMGGVDAEFTVSDHGNINASRETEIYLRSLANELALENNVSIDD